MSSSSQITQITQTLREDFRGHLETFFATLQLAPPYHTVEKALLCFTSSLQEMTLEELQQLSLNPQDQWDLYQKAFVKSGLNQKHRGIILRLIRENRISSLPTYFQPFLHTYSL